MLSLDDDERLDQAIERHALIIERLNDRQGRLEQRIANLYQGVAIAFTLVVVSLSFLVIILSQQLPALTLALAQMNERFAGVAANLVQMDRAMGRMGGSLGHFPEIVAHIDHIQFGVTGLSGDVGTTGETLAAMDLDLGVLTTSIGDLRQSFEVMETYQVRSVEPASGGKP